MGTNYYLEDSRNVCEHCDCGFKEWHIGKSSYGWTFAMHVYPNDGILCLTDWMPRLEDRKCVIKDEYGRTITVAELMKIITERKHDRDSEWSPEDYRLNHAVPGPNGLARCEVDGWHCLAHGTGTWDYCVGDFC